MFGYGREIKARTPLDKEGLWKIEPRFVRKSSEELSRFEIHFDISRQIWKPQPFRTFDHALQMMMEDSQVVSIYVVIDPLRRHKMT